MSNELQYYGYPDQTGLTVTAKVYDAAGAQVGSDITTTEVGSLGIYTANMPSAPFGQYGVRFFSGATLVGQGFINWDGSKEMEFNLDVSISSIWSEAIESGYTASDILKVLAAFAAGKTSITALGGGDATVVFRDLGDTKDRIEAGMEGSERTSVTLDTV
jgi:hypothetical protein